MMNVRARVLSFLLGGLIAMPWAVASAAWDVAVPESASSATVRLAAPDGTISDHPFQNLPGLRAEADCIAKTDDLINIL